MKDGGANKSNGVHDVQVYCRKKICELCGIVAEICLLFSKVAVVGQIFPIGMFQCLVRSSSLSVKAEAALAEAGRCNSGSRLPVRVFYFLLKKTARQRHQAAALSGSLQSPAAGSLAHDRSLPVGGSSSLSPSLPVFVTVALCETSLY